MQKRARLLMALVAATGLHAVLGMARVGVTKAGVTDRPLGGWFLIGKKLLGASDLMFSAIDTAKGVL